MRLSKRRNEIQISKEINNKLLCGLWKSLPSWVKMVGYETVGIH